MEHRRHDDRRVRRRALLLAGVGSAAMIPLGLDSWTGSQVDAFGVTHLRPGLPGGLSWVSQWDPPRTIEGRDPLDPWVDGGHGEGSFRAGEGQLHVSGNHPRLHVRHPSLTRQWRNVEITMYARAVRRGPAYAGMVAVARTNHGLTGDVTVDRCDSRGLGARLRYDGWVDLEKETAHPANTVMTRRQVWPGGFPLLRWIGFKFVVRDIGSIVRLEVWRDLAEGRGGGQWRRLLVAHDDGWTTGGVACAAGIDARSALLAGPDRAGSESGLPNLSVYFRTDGVGRDGLSYRWGSIREIR